MLNFAIGQILFRMSGFITPIVILMTIGASDFAIFELYLAYTSILAPVLLIGTDVAFTYFTASDKVAKTSENVWLPLYIAFFQSLICLVIIQFINLELINSVLLVTYTFAQSIFLTALKIFRIDRQDQKYLRQAAIALILLIMQYSILYLSRSIVLFIFVRTIFYILQTIFILKSSHATPFRFYKVSEVVKYLRYGVPLVPYAFLFGLLIGIDKILYKSQLEIMRELALASRISQILLIYFVIFKIWYNPVFFRLQGATGSILKGNIVIRIFEVTSILILSISLTSLDSILKHLSNKFAPIEPELLISYLIAYFCVGVFSVRLVVYNANQTNIYTSIPVIFSLGSYYMLFELGYAPERCLLSSIFVLLFIEILLDFFIHSGGMLLALEKFMIIPLTGMILYGLNIFVVICTVIILFFYKDFLRLSIEVLRDRS